MSGTSARGTLDVNREMDMLKTQMGLLFMMVVGGGGGVVCGVVVVVMG